MANIHSAAPRLRSILLSTIAAGALIASSSFAWAALSPLDQTAIQQQVASSLSTANEKNEGDIATIAQELDGVTEQLVQKYGAANAKDVAAAVVSAALDDGAPAEAVGRGLALAALNLGGTTGNAVADGVGNAADPATLASFNQNATASNTPEGTAFSQEAERAQGEAETAGNRREPQRYATIGSVVVPSTGVAGGPVENQETNAITGKRPLDVYFQPKGIPLGRPFRLFANLYDSASYDDNVYRVPSPGKQSSVFFTVNPTLVLDYDTSRVKLDLYGDTDIYKYASLGQVDTTTYDAGLRGQYDISEAAIFTGNVSQSLLDESLQSPNTVGNQKRANQFNLFDGTGSFTYKRGRIGLQVGGSLDLYSFTATPLFGGTLMPNGDRNNDIYKGLTKVSYDFSPGYSIFVRGSYNTDHYNEQVADRDKVFRSSHGYQVDGGVDLLLGDLANGEIYAGYLQQDYIHFPKPGATTTIPNISGIDFGANINWYPTELLTVHLSASRQLENTVVVSTVNNLNVASAGDDRNVGLSAEYELLREVSLTGNLGYDDTNYKGSNREDKTVLAGVGGKWLINHYMWADVKYQYSIRSSSVPASGYNDNLISLGLNLQI